MVGFRGSTQEKQRLEIFRFGYGKALNDKKVPDRVGSGVLVLQKLAQHCRMRLEIFGVFAAQLSLTKLKSLDTTPIP